MDMQLESGVSPLAMQQSMLMQRNLVYAATNSRATSIGNCPRIPA